MLKINNIMFSETAPNNSGRTIVPPRGETIVPPHEETNVSSLSLRFSSQRNFNRSLHIFKTYSLQPSSQSSSQSQRNRYERKSQSSSQSNRYERKLRRIQNIDEQRFNYAYGGRDYPKKIFNLTCSSYVFSRFNNEIFKKIPNNHFCLVVGYMKNNCFIDAQPPGITGKGKIFSNNYVETPEEAAIRELGEETGLLPTTKLRQPDPEINFFLLDACNIIKRTDSKMIHPGSRENNKNRIGIMVHGSLDDMKKVLNIAIAAEKDDNIGYVYIVHKLHAMNIYKHAQSNHYSQCFSYNFIRSQGTNIKIINS